MKNRWVLAMGLVLLLGGAGPATAQMTGMMEMMGGGVSEPTGIGCPWMGAQPVALGRERPWISFALAHAKELELTADQAKGLSALRDEFQKEALRLLGEIRTAEADVQRLLSRSPAEFPAVEAKIRGIAGLEADLRVGRLKTLEKGKALLTPEQREKLGELARSMGQMRGAFMMGGPPESTR